MLMGSDDRSSPAAGAIIRNSRSAINKGAFGRTEIEGAGCGLRRASLSMPIALFRECDSESSSLGVGTNVKPRRCFGRAAMCRFLWNLRRADAFCVEDNTQERIMKMKSLAIAVLTVATLPCVAYAQGTVRGAEEGAAAGGRAAGPAGAIVGGAVGAATGTVGGILGVEERPRFREYVVREHRPSYRLRDDVRVGVVLPERGVRLYDVPREYHVRPGYRYAIVNEVPVIVEPRSRRIVEVIE